MAFQIPTVTEDDLRAFHAKHFPNALLPEQIIHQGEAGARNGEEEYYDPEDDGLGYYEDGVKRTLTDEQIALFRHTEIHTILRERRRRKEMSQSPEPGMRQDEAMGSPQRAFGDARSGAPSARPTSDGASNTAHSGATDKSTYWKRKLTPAQQHRNAVNRKKNRKKRTEKRRHKREGREGSLGSGHTGEQMEEDGESDEWDPWHQANGPDAQKDATVDLDY